MLQTAFSPWPAFSEEEVQAAAKVIASGRVNYWTGTEARAFEREFADWTGAANAVAVSNGTVALDLALRCLDIGPGDEVIVTPRTFIASVSCVVTAGATPVFADVDRDSGNIAPDTIAPLLTERTRAIIPVHLAGWPADVPMMLDMIAGRNIAIIEDCAQAHGAQIDGRSVGTFGRAGAWSFCQDKIMTTGGEGGMVITDDAELWSRMWSYKDHGKSWDTVYERTHAPGFRWLHESFGTNWRMLEVQAAIGRLQIGYMPDWTARRTHNARRMTKALQRHSDVVRVPEPVARNTHAYYRLYAYVKPEALAAGWNRDRVLDAMVSAGLPAFQGTCPEVYREKAFDGTPWRPTVPLPVAHELGETSLMFLTHPNLTKAEMDRACAVIDEVLTKAAR